MPRLTEPPPICQPLSSPVIVPAEEAFVVPLAIRPEDAAKTAREAILGSFLRPYDIQQAEVSPVALVHLPFWRVEASVSGFHLGLDVATNEQGGIKWVLPTGGARHRDAILLVTARRNFPYEPLMIRVPGVVAFQRVLHPFEINLEEMVPRASHTIAEGEVVEPDVTRAMAEREAMDRILRAVRPASALYANYKPEVRGAAFCHYPLYIIRYGYDGHAKRDAGEAFYVTISGRSGKIVGSRHPSAARALARKFRRFLA
jgi:hypothetical protein